MVLRFFHPDKLPQSAATAQPHTTESVTRVVQNYEGMHLPLHFDRDDVEWVSRYVKRYDDEDQTTWRKVLEGGETGASWFIHELTELRYLTDTGVDFTDRLARAEIFPQAHGLGLIAEHNYLYRLALRMGYNVNEGSLLRYNPTVSAKQNMQDWDMAKKLNPSLTFDAADKTAVEAFFEALL
jgi:hypothetical protein